MNDLALHILDIVQNSIRANATFVKILVWENILRDLLTIEIADDGSGMSAEQIRKVFDPFFTSRTTRKVGMGLPLFKQSAEQCGGGVTIDSKIGEGTVVKATFQISNLDCPPMGELGNVIVLLASSNVNVRIIFEYRYNEESYIFDTMEIKEILGDVPLNNPKIISYLDEMVSNNIQNIKNN